MELVGWVVSYLVSCYEMPYLIVFRMIILLCI